MTHRTRERETRSRVSTTTTELAPTHGEALPPAVAHGASSQFAHSFADVRVHADADGDRVARAHDARAVTVGNDLFFRAGAYAPETELGARVLGHELAHVVQQLPNEPEAERRVAPNDERGTVEERAESEADVAAEALLQGGTPTVQPGSVAPGTAQAWPWDDEPTAAAASAPASGGSLWDSVGSMASGAWDATKSAAGAVYDGYEKSTNFTALQKGDAKAADAAKGQVGEGFIRGGINGLIDDWTSMSDKGNDQMVKEAEGHWYSPLAQASSWLNKTTTDATAGVAKGVGDIGFGLANAIAHPIDASKGLLGIAEHDLPGVGSLLKAGHGMVDLGLDAAGVNYEGQGQYGKSSGDLANHVLNPLQSTQDDAQFNTGLMQGIVDPDHKGLQGLKDKPLETVTRAITNILPMALGVGEAMGGDAAEGASAASKASPLPPDSAPPTLRTPYLPDGVPAPKPFVPDIPVVDPPALPPEPRVINPGGGPVQINPTHPIYPDAGAPTVMPPTVEIPPDTIPQQQPFPKPAGDPLSPQPQPKLPGGPKEGPPIPREDPPSRPVDTQRTPMDVPGIPQDDPLPSTKPRPAIPDGPVTQDAPPSSGGSAVPTEPGIGPVRVPAIPRGMDPGGVIQLLLDTPGGGSVTELLRDLGMPIEMR